MSIKQSTPMIEFLYTWFFILLITNILGVAFIITSSNVPYNTLTDSDIVNKLTLGTSGVVSPASSTASSANPSDLNGGTGVTLSVILNPIDLLISIVKFIAGIILFAGIGSLITTATLWTYISANGENLFLAFVVNIITVIIGVIFFIKLYNTATKKGVQE